MKSFLVQRLFSFFLLFSVFSSHFSDCRANFFANLFGRPVSIQLLNPIGAAERTHRPFFCKKEPAMKPLKIAPSILIFQPTIFNK
jgi:hypothetical protein